jgi:hypothetical protein
MPPRNKGLLVTLVMAGSATGLRSFPFSSSGDYPDGSMNKITYYHILANSLDDKVRQVGRMYKQLLIYTELALTITGRHILRPCIKCFLQHGDHANYQAGIVLEHSIKKLKLCLITGLLSLIKLISVT